MISIILSVLNYRSSNSRGGLRNTENTQNFSYAVYI